MHERIEKVDNFNFTLKWVFRYSHLVLPKKRIIMYGQYIIYNSVNRIKFVAEIDFPCTRIFQYTIFQILCHNHIFHEIFLCSINDLRNFLQSIVLQFYITLNFRGEITTNLDFTQKHKGKQNTGNIKFGISNCKTFSYGRYF